MEGPSDSDRFLIRRARWADLVEIHRSYRGQPPESRELYHPFPFGRFRLAAVLTVLWGTGHAGRAWVRAAPRTAAVLFAARDASGGTLAGYGTVRFRRDRSGNLIARTGLFVVPERRRAGVGRALKEGLMRHARALGAVRAEAFLLPANTASAELNRQLGLRVRPATRTDPAEAQGLWIAEGDLEVAVSETGPKTPPGVAVNPSVSTESVN